MTFFRLVQQVSDDHEIVGKHSCTNEQLEPLTALGQTSLHAAAAKEHGDTALNACPEALCFFELGALFESLPLRGSFSTPLRNAQKLHSLAHFDVLITEKTSVRTVPSGSQAKSLLMTLK